MIKKILPCNCIECEHNYCTPRVPIFSTLNQEQLSVLARLIKHKTYEKGQHILVEGQQMENLVFINKGSSKAFKNSYQGREQILYIFSEGDFFGEANLLSQQIAPYTVSAMTQIEICVINKKDFHQLLLDFPDIGIRVIEGLSHKIDKLELTVRSLTSNVESRLNEVLLEFSRKYSEVHPKGLMVNLPLNREGIANYIGASRETICRKMKILENEGVIELIGNKKVLILNPHALES